MKKAKELLGLLGESTYRGQNQKQFTGVLYFMVNDVAVVSSDQEAMLDQLLIASEEKFIAEPQTVTLLMLPIATWLNTCH